MEFKNFSRAAKQKGLRASIKTRKAYRVRHASYRLHKPSWKNFQRNQTVVEGIDNQWQADLADRQEGANYILTIIDVFSKFSWAIPVKHNGGLEMKNAFEHLFKISNPLKPEKLQTSAVIMENLATAIPEGDNILQCSSGLSALTRFLIITADVASYESGG